MRRSLLFALLVGCTDVSDPFADPRELVLEAPADTDPMCIDTPLDDVLEAPGVQVDCEVEDVLGNTVTTWRSRNYSGELADVLRDFVLIGEGGCGFEQPLASMRAGSMPTPQMPGSCARTPCSAYCS